MRELGSLRAVTMKTIEKRLNTAAGVSIVIAFAIWIAHIILPMNEKSFASPFAWLSFLILAIILEIGSRIARRKERG